MTPLKTIQKFALIAIAFTLAAGQSAMAQATPDQDAARNRLGQSLVSAQTTLQDFDTTVTSAKKQLDTVRRTIGRISQEVKAGRPKTDAYRELVFVAEIVESTEQDINLVAGRLPDLRDMLVGISSMALRFEFYDIHRYANIAVVEADELARSAGVALTDSSQLKAEIARMMASLSRR